MEAGQRQRTQCFLWLLCGYFAKGYDYPPLITYPPSSDIGALFLIVPKFADLFLECAVEKPDNSTDIIWRRSKTQPLPLGWMRPADSLYDPPTAPFVAAEVRLPYQRIMHDYSQYEGFYECYANNSAGETVSGPVSVKFGDASVPSTINPDEFRHVTAYRGSKLELPCNSSMPLRVFPSHLDLPIDARWHRADLKATFGNDRTSQINPHLDGRFAINEIGTLYIRPVTGEDDTGRDFFLRCAIKQTFAKGVNERVAGAYRITVTSGGTPLSSSRNLYNTPDVTVPAGHSVFLSCVFEEKNGRIDEVQWQGPTAISASGANKNIIRLDNVDSQHNGDWRCTYRPEHEASISRVTKVTVLQYPIMANLTDEFVFVGYPVSINCTLIKDTQGIFQWFWNDRTLIDGGKFRIVSTRLHSTLTLSSPAPSDTGVISCAATNTVGKIKTSARLMVYGCPKALPKLTISDWYRLDANATARCEDVAFPFAQPTIVMSAGDGREPIAINFTYVASKGEMVADSVTMHLTKSWNGLTLSCSSTIAGCPERVSVKTLNVYYIFALSDLKWEMTVRKNQRLELDCSKYVDSNPDAAYQWFVDQYIPIGNNSFLDLILGDEEETAAISNLTCQATNHYVEVFFRFHIAIVRPLQSVEERPKRWCGSWCLIGLAASSGLLVIVACIGLIACRKKKSAAAPVEVEIGTLRSEDDVSYRPAGSRQRGGMPRRTTSRSSASSYSRPITGTTGTRCRNAPASTNSRTETEYGASTSGQRQSDPASSASTRNSRRGGRGGRLRGAGRRVLTARKMLNKR